MTVLILLMMIEMIINTTFILYIRFDILSVLKALFWDPEKCVINFQVEIENMEIYLEKLRVKSSKSSEKKDFMDRSTINFWCALASVTVAEQVYEPYSGKIKNFFSSSTSSKKQMQEPTRFIPSNSIPDPSWEHIPQQSFPPKPQQSQKMMDTNLKFMNSNSVPDPSWKYIPLQSFPPNKVVQTNFSSVTYESGEKDSLKASHGESMGSISLENDGGPSELLQGMRKPSTWESTKSLFLDRDDSFDGTSYESSDGTRHRDGANITVIEEDNNEENFDTPIIGNIKTPTIETNNHMGIKYKFEMMRFILRDLKVHAQDFLNATHSEVDDKKVIRLSHIHMDYKQLNSHTNSIGLGKNNGHERKESERDVDIREDNIGMDYVIYVYLYMMYIKMIFTNIVYLYLRIYDIYIIVIYIHICRGILL